jgi:hypothetical protein
MKYLANTHVMNPKLAVEMHHAEPGIHPFFVKAITIAKDITKRPAVSHAYSLEGNTNKVLNMKTP